MDAIAVRLLGGLGNQLFQYAAARATSLRLGCRLLLETAALETPEAGVTQRTYVLGAFAIAAERYSVAPGEWREYNEPHYHYDPSFEAIGPGTRLNGYFQSPLYFAAQAEAIRREISLAAAGSPAFTDFAARIRGSALPVSLHLRRGDFAADPHTLSFHGICGPEHYRRAMRIVEGLVGATPTYVVFSDDAAEARRLFGALPGAIFVATPQAAPWEDMLLMSLCRHHILANSSFSWWGSWLNASPDKIVVAPRAWVAREALRKLNTADLHPEGTILI